MITILDNFFDDPFAIRNSALKQRYQYEDFNYPGLRTYGVSAGVADYVQSQVRYYTKDSSAITSSCTFHYITKEFKSGFFHKDTTAYGVIVFLSLDAPPHTGTEICDSDQVFDSWDDEKVIKTLSDFHKDPHNLIKAYRYDRLKKKALSFYKPIIKVPNKFNRGIIFSGKRHFHRAQDSFGTSVENARLTLVSFIKNENDDI